MKNSSSPNLSKENKTAEIQIKMNQTETNFPFSQRPGSKNLQPSLRFDLSTLNSISLQSKGMGLSPLSRFKRKLKKEHQNQSYSWPQGQGFGNPLEKQVQETINKNKIYGYPLPYFTANNAHQNTTYILSPIKNKVKDLTYFVQKTTKQAKKRDSKTILKPSENVSLQNYRINRNLRVQFSIQCQDKDQKEETKLVSEQQKKEQQGNKETRKVQQFKWKKKYEVNLDYRIQKQLKHENIKLPTLVNSHEQEDLQCIHTEPNQQSKSFDLQQICLSQKNRNISQNQKSQTGYNSKIILQSQIPLNTSGKHGQHLKVKKSLLNVKKQLLQAVF